MRRSCSTVWNQRPTIEARCTLYVYDVNHSNCELSVVVYTASSSPVLSCWRGGVVRPRTSLLASFIIAPPLHSSLERIFVVLSIERERRVVSGDLVSTFERVRSIIICVSGACSNGILQLKGTAWRRVEASRVEALRHNDLLASPSLIIHLSLPPRRQQREPC